MDENIKKTKKFGIGFYFLMFGLITFIVGFYFGTNKEPVKENKDISVFVDYELQTFRTEKGFRLYPIEYKGNLYIPYNGLGSFLDYMTVENQENGNINLITLENDINLKPLKDLNTENYKGEKIDSSIFNNSEYTALFVIATWCPDCKDLLKDLRENKDYFNDKDIQFLTLVVDAPTLENKDKMTKEFENKVYEQTDGISFSHYLFSDETLRTKIIGNIVNIPKMVVYDREGYLVKIIDDMSFYTLKNTFDGIYGFEGKNND